MYLNSPGVPTHSLRHIKLFYIKANREHLPSVSTCKVHGARHSGRDAYVFFGDLHTHAYAYLCMLELSGFPVLIHNQASASLPHHTASSGPREHFKQKQETSGSTSGNISAN